MPLTPRRRSLPLWALGSLTLGTLGLIVGGFDRLDWPAILQYQLYLNAAKVPLALAILAAGPVLQSWRQPRP
ncbi:MAG: hypothetical protein HC918_10565 [Oscillatoriales cyanobacterium SM2_1_8]|nr:hypothetical protein [Oscillatoriales cyanobacterium SM2_1_8]